MHAGLSSCISPIIDRKKEEYLFCKKSQKIPQSGHVLTIETKNLQVFLKKKISEIILKSFKSEKWF